METYFVIIGYWIFVEIYFVGTNRPELVELASRVNQNNESPQNISP